MQIKFGNSENLIEIKNFSETFTEEREELHIIIDSKEISSFRDFSRSIKDVSQVELYEDNKLSLLIEGIKLTSATRSYTLGGEDNKINIIIQFQYI